MQLVVQQLLSLSFSLYREHTVIQITGFVIQSSSNADDPFADASASWTPSQDQEKDALQKFFQNAGVNFEGV